MHDSTQSSRISTALQKLTPAHTVAWTQQRILRSLSSDGSLLRPTYWSPIPFRRHVFVDCGGHNGCSVRKFLKEIDPRGRFEIITFEPNDIFGSRYSEFPRHSLIQAAVHVRDGEEFFFLDREVGYGSSLFKEKTTGGIDTGSPIRVPTVDLSKWLMENTSQNDYIILKLDVEGAEYDILEKMIADGSIRRVRHIFAEWHWHKIHVPESRHLSLQEELKRLRIRVVEWNAGNY